MLNELLIIERGARQAGVDMAQLHPDVKDCRRVPTLLVRLYANGQVALVRPVPPDVKLWTLRDGQQNSFPFVQPKPPLLAVPDGDERRDRAVDRRADGRREALLALANEMELNVDAFNRWPGVRFLARLRGRQGQLSLLNQTDGEVVPATIDRFMIACDPKVDGGPQLLLRTVMQQIVAELRQTAQDEWLEVAVALLLGKFIKKGRWECTGALLFEAEGFHVRIFDPKGAIQVSRVIGGPRQSETDRDRFCICGLTGEKAPLLSGNFPQPNLPVLGQTYIFAKNTEIPANDRYGRFAAEAMPVGQDTAERLAAALKALTIEERRGRTWRGISREATSEKDLLLAFVEAAPDAPAAGMLAEGDAEEDFSEEALGTVPDASGSISAFEKRTERLIEAVQAKVTGDFRQTPVYVAMFRKIDPANRKVVYAGAPTVAELYDAAMGWVAGERNVPPWFTLQIFRKGEIKPFPMAPPHIPPLGVIPFSKQLFIRRGTERQEVVGMPAAEVLGLFLDSTGAKGSAVRRRTQRFLRMVLARRDALVSGTAHAQRRELKFMKKFDGREALRTVTMLGLLLHKLGRTKEDYMSDTAFKLGQLLAAADVVHAGYCADLRSGEVPPSLLGNQVLTMAQTAPVKALATLSRRWKPYDGWAKKAARERARADKLAKSGGQAEKQRGWDIRKAVRYAREMGLLAEELGSLLPGCEVNDTFRAELLLGYIAGLPKAKEMDNVDTGNKNENTTTGGEEE